MSRRTERVNDLIREELSDLLLRELRDPRLDGLLISITHVEVAPDLSNARVAVSVMAEPEVQADVVKALVAASGFLHRELKRRIEIRRIPILSFRLDTSIERGAEVLSLLGDVSHSEPPEA